MDHRSGTATRPSIPWPLDPIQPSGAASPTHDLPGFGPLTPIQTDFGLVPAQALRARDRVRLCSGRYCPIDWIDRWLLDEAFLAHHQDAQPVLVRPDRLGNGLPAQPILLAPGQKLSGGQGYCTLLRTARDLLRGGMADRNPERFVTYVVFGFAEVEDVCSAGLWLRVEPPQAFYTRDADEA